MWIKKTDLYKAYNNKIFNKMDAPTWTSTTASSECSVRRCMLRKAHKALKSLLGENLCQAFCQSVDH